MNQKEIEEILEAKKHLEEELGSPFEPAVAFIRGEDVNIKKNFDGSEVILEYNGQRVWMPVEVYRELAIVREK